jgi:UDP-glucuronate 4-epimerase
LAPYRIFNIGRGNPVNLLDFVSEIEKNIGFKAEKIYLPMQDGDVSETWADISDLKNQLGYQPKVSVKEGVKNFVDWYKEYYAYKEQEVFA